MSTRMVSAPPLTCLTGPSGIHCPAQGGRDAQVEHGSLIRRQTIESLFGFADVSLQRTGKTARNGRRRPGCEGAVRQCHRPHPVVPRSGPHGLPSYCSAISVSLVQRATSEPRSSCACSSPVKTRVGGDIEIHECNRNRNVWIVAATDNLG